MPSLSSSGYGYGWNRAHIMDDPLLNFCKYEQFSQLLVQAILKVVKCQLWVVLSSISSPGWLCGDGWNREHRAVMTPTPCWLEILLGLFMSLPPPSPQQCNAQLCSKLKALNCTFLQGRCCTSSCLTSKGGHLLVYNNLQTALHIPKIILLNLWCFVKMLLEF